MNVELLMFFVVLSHSDTLVVFGQVGSFSCSDDFTTVSGSYTNSLSPMSAKPSDDLFGFFAILFAI